MKGRRTGPRMVCRCECGGVVMGVREFGQLWTYCTKCTPVVKITVTKRGTPLCLEQAATPQDAER
jgi:hypothetical protein